MKRKGIGSIIAAIFLVLLVGISMMAFLSVYNEYKNIALTESKMNNWESLRAREKLVRLGQSGGGGGGNTTYTLNRTFLVSGEHVEAGDQLTVTPRLWLFDSEDNDYEHIDSIHGNEVNATFTILTTQLNAYAGENWNFVLKMNLQIISANTNVAIYAYNHQTNQFDLIDSFETENASPFEWSKNLSWGTYVDDENATIRIYEEKEHGIAHLRIDKMILEGVYTYNQPISYDKYYVTSTEPSYDLSKIRERDGNCITSAGDLELTCTISGLPTTVTYRDISSFVTIAASWIGEYNVEIYAYDYSNNLWVLKNTTHLNPNEEQRIRVPLSTDYISNTGNVKLKIEADNVGGLFVYLDEVVAEATWLTSEGGGGGGGATTLVIKNESPFTSRIVRIWYINSTGYYIYNPSSPIALKPGETLDLSTYHSLSGVTLVKVITDYGNIFAFSP